MKTLLNALFLIGLYRKADTTPRMKHFGHAVRQFSPYTSYHMAFSMLRDGYSIKALYARKFLNFNAIDAAIKSAREVGILSHKKPLKAPAIQCSHCPNTSEDTNMRVVNALNPIVYCEECYRAFNED